MWITPVYNRTLFDIQAKTSKAFINTADLNRIEGNMQRLASILHCGINTKEWTDGEFIFLSELQRMRENLLTLTSAYTLTDKSPAVPQLPFVIYSQWNDIEKILYDMYTLFYANQARVPYCGEVYAGTEIGVI